MVSYFDYCLGRCFIVVCFVGVLRLSLKDEFLDSFPPVPFAPSAVPFTLSVLPVVPIGNV